ncbi:MAG: tyrosine-type recombinase/integrase, partial [Shimia sp.]|nr:tyrosine-type recombinase/integrase [Shimia sp.]
MVSKTPAEITLHDVDTYIEQCQLTGHANSTINRRLAALRTFYRFLAVESDEAPPNPVLPWRHFIKQGLRLPRDVPDDDLSQLFAVIDDPRDRAMFMLMLRCGLRVGEVQRLAWPDLYLSHQPPSLPRLWIHGKNEAQRVVYLSNQALTAL